jgi:hypothetical protein
MHSLVLDGESFSVPLGPLVTNCHLFHENRVLLVQPSYTVRSRVSLPSFRTFLGAIGGLEAGVTGDNANDLALLAAEFKFAALSKSVADYQAAHPSLGAGVRLVTSGLADRLRSQERAICDLDARFELMLRSHDSQRAALGGVGQMLQQHQAALADVQAAAIRDREEVAQLKRTITKAEGKNRRLAAELRELRADSNRVLQSGIGRLEAATREAIAATKENQQELAKLKEEVKAIKSKSSALVPPNPPLSAPPEPPRPAPPRVEKRFPPSVKKGPQFRVPNGIIAHLTKECGGNVHDLQVVNVTSSQPYSGDPENAARNVTAGGIDSWFFSAGLDKKQDVPHARNNWLCYDFKQRKIVPTHYAIRSGTGVGTAHLKSWVVETSADGCEWQQIDHKEGSDELKGDKVTSTFAVSGAGPCRFIRLVQIGRNHFGTSRLFLSAWEIFGSLLE